MKKILFFILTISVIFASSNDDIKIGYFDSKN